MPTLRAWLREGPFALGLSSGFFAFFAHTGLMTVLEDEGLLPARVTGSSAGALVGGAWAGGVDAPVLARELERLERKDFWDPAPGLGLLRGRLFREKLDALVGRRSFAGARVPATLSVHGLRSRRTHVLASGELAPAIHASCALPLLFHPVRIDGRLYVDGGVSDRHGLAGVPDDGTRLFFHHIARHAPPLPARANTMTLVLDDLPPAGPFALDAGRRALAAARRAARAALDRPADARGVVRVAVS